MDEADEGDVAQQDHMSAFQLTPATLPPEARRSEPRRAVQAKVMTRRQWQCETPGLCFHPAGTSEETSLLPPAALTPRPGKCSAWPPRSSSLRGLPAARAKTDLLRRSSRVITVQPMLGSRSRTLASSGGRYSPPTDPSVMDSMKIGPLPWR